MTEINHHALAPPSHGSTDLDDEITTIKMGNALAAIGHGKNVDGWHIHFGPGKRALTYFLAGIIFRDVNQMRRLDKIACHYAKLKNTIDDACRDLIERIHQ